MLTWALIGIIMGIINLIISVAFLGRSATIEMIQISLNFSVLMTIGASLSYIVVWAAFGPLGLLRNIYDVIACIVVKKYEREFGKSADDNIE